MSAQDRLNWISRGSPFRLMTPAADLRDLLRRYGYTVYDIGNRSHLEHEPPEDHTPYSETGYPGRAQYGVGYAIDIMPPTKTGLPSLQQLGAQLLRDRKTGVAGIRWLKYMNWEPQRNNGGDCWHESWQPTYARRSSSDRGHIHLSGLTGYETSTIGRGYDPVARIRGDDDMTFEEVRRATFYGFYDAITQAATRTTKEGRWMGNPGQIGTLLSPITETLRALGEAVAAESSNPDELRAALASLPTPPTADEVAEATVARLGEESPDDAAQALLAVLGQERTALLAAALTAAAASQG